MKSPWFSIMMNCTYKSLFKSTQNLRQDDPFSLYLFILGQKVLSRMLHKDFDGGRVGSFSHSRGSALVYHLLYANDILVFMNSERHSLKKLLKTLESYDQNSFMPNMSRPHIFLN